MDRLRAAAAAAALILAVTSRGDALGLAVLLAVVAWRPMAAVATGAALVAASWRWGSTSLEAIAGAQAVLGPAGLVGPDAAAAASWLAAAAIVLATSDLRAGVRGGSARSARAGARDVVAGVVNALPAMASGAAAAVVVAGPAPGGDVWVRVLAAVAGAALAFGVAAIRGRGGRTPYLVDSLALAVGIGALAVVRPEAPAWSGTIDTSAAASGALTAVAVGVLVVTGGSALAVGRRQA